MRTVGVDLAISGTHQAVVMDEQGEFLGAPFSLAVEAASLDDLVRRARRGAAADTPVQVVMEPTGLSWLPLASYWSQRGVIIHLVNTQQAAALHKVYAPHAKSDRISAQVLARLPRVSPETLHPLQVAGADYLSGQRWCKQQEELMQLSTAIKNRIQAWERGFWPGLEAVVGDLFAPWVRRWREQWYDPWQLVQAQPSQLAAALVAAGAEPAAAAQLATDLQAVARRVIALFGTPAGGSAPHVDYAALQEQVLREQRLLATCEIEHQGARQQAQRLYRRLHPARQLQSLKGVGADGAAVYVFFIHDIARFTSQAAFRGWSGMVPASAQSGDLEQKGLHITAAGPDLVKKYAYLNAEVARQWDPQIAAIYYDQMVHKDKHHVAAVCCCATHLLDRVRVVLRTGQPYELRDVAGQPVTVQEARTIIEERYHVPDAVRQRNSQRTRRAQRRQQATKKQLRRSQPAE